MCGSHRPARKGVWFAAVDLTFGTRVFTVRRFASSHCIDQDYGYRQTSDFVPDFAVVTTMWLLLSASMGHNTLSGYADPMGDIGISDFEEMADDPTTNCGRRSCELQ